MQLWCVGLAAGRQTGSWRTLENLPRPGLGVCSEDPRITDIPPPGFDDTAQEPRPGPARPGQRRQQGPATPWVDEYQRIPPLISRVPVKIWRTHMGIGVKSSFGRHKAPRNSHLPPPEQIKLQTEELHAIRAELSQIKAQVDHLLDSLELLDQQKDQLPGAEDIEENRHPGSKDSSCRTTEPQQKPRGQREVDSSKESAGPEEAVKNHASGQEGGQ